MKGASWCVAYKCLRKQKKNWKKCVKQNRKKNDLRRRRQDKKKNIKTSSQVGGKREKEFFLFLFLRIRVGGLGFG